MSVSADAGALVEVADLRVRFTGERIAGSIGPAFDAFAGIAGTLPFDLEPATFALVQIEKAAR